MVVERRITGKYYAEIVIYKKEQNSISDSKVLFTYKDEGGKYLAESLWASKEGTYYRIDNIPFLVSNIALNDLVSVEEDGTLYFDSLIKASAHSVVQLAIFNENDVLKIGKEFEARGCSWEGSHIKN